MRKVLANGIQLHYQQHGQGPDVVLVHGVTSDLSYWLLTVVPRLAERHRVTVYDLRGHGYSDVPPAGYTSRDMAEDLRGLMDALGIERAVDRKWRTVDRKFHLSNHGQDPVIGAGERHGNGAGIGDRRLPRDVEHGPRNELDDHRRRVAARRRTASNRPER